MVNATASQPPVQAAGAWSPLKIQMFRSIWLAILARADAVYTTPAPLVALPGSAGGARRIGTQYKSETRWQASEHWQWQLQLAWVDAGPALKQAGGQDTLFASIVGAWQW
ncbi:unnamed protein product [Stenotrophomonas maltophilia]|nr:unnamed protein product [Stenotrophomonas maltophilia]